VISGIDRTRRARSGTSLGTVLDAKEANRGWFFSNFHVFSAFFCGFFDSWGGQGGIFGNFFFGIDRAHRVLLGTSETRVGTHMYANRFQKKSNPCLRYPTFICMSFRISIL